MAINPAHWTVTRSNGNVRYIGDDHGGASPTYASVLELRRWLGGLADDEQSSGDDELAIYDPDPADRSTDNIIRLKAPYNITATEAEHLYDGSIIQGSGGTEEIWDGIVNYGNASVQIQIIQNGAVLTDDWWNFGGGGLNADAAQGISHRFLIKVRNAGADIDGRRLIGTTRVFGKTYGEFKINGTARGNNTLALSNTTDLNNSTAVGTVATWTTITNVVAGYNGIDVNNDGSDEFFYSEWNRDTYSINQFYERMKYLVRDGSAETLYGLSGELFRGITHELDVDGGSGTWGTPEHEEITWGTGATAGTAQLLAVDNKTGTSTTKIWFQLLTGVVPADNLTITGTTSGATAVAERTGGTLTEVAVSTPFVGASTGTSLVGAYGLGVEYLDLQAADKVFDLTGTQYSPPNNQTFTVTGLVATEDRVLAAPWDGSTLDAEGNPAIDAAQFTLQTSLLGATETAVVITGSIPVDTPSTGTIRVILDDGRHWYQPYLSWTGSTFTIASADYSVATGNGGATAANTLYVSYIDELVPSGTTASFTATYVSDRNLVVIVRDGASTPIKQYISAAVFNSGGGGVPAVRTSDE